MENKDIINFILIGLIIIFLFVLQNNVNKIMKRLKLDEVKEDSKKNKQQKKTSTENFSNADIVEHYGEEKKLVTLDSDGNMDTFSFPRGMIVIWSGSKDLIPSGWSLCDGKNGTPNLSGRFVLGVGSKSIIINEKETKNYDYQVNEKGGVEIVKLEEKHMPEHSHTLKMSKGDKWWGGSDHDSNTYWGQNQNIETLTTNSVGGNQPHENMPPYYSLCYIMKTTD
jgi:microcystin-dependent protein